MYYVNAQCDLWGLYEPVVLPFVNITEFFCLQGTISIGYFIIRILCWFMVARFDPRKIFWFVDRKIPGSKCSFTFKPPPPNNLSSNSCDVCVNFVFRHKPSKNLEKSETAHLNGLEYFDPFVERNLEHPTTWVHTHTDEFCEIRKISKSFDILINTFFFRKNRPKFVIFDYCYL